MRIGRRGAVGEQADELLGVERVAARPLQQRALRLRREHRALEEQAEKTRRLVLGERREVDRGRVAKAGRPVRIPLVELRARGADDHQRHARRPVGQVLEEGEQRAVGPVEVLEDQHGGPLLGQGLQEAPPCRERLLLRGGFAARADERRQPRAQPGEVGVVRREPAVELRLRRLWRVGLEDPALGLDDLSQRPVRDALAVGEAAALAPHDEVGPGVDVCAQLGAHAALAHAGLADDRHQLAGPLLRAALERADQQRLLELAAHERGRVRARDVGAEPGAGGERAPDRQRLGLALDRRRRQLLVVEDPLRLPEGVLGHRDPVHRRGSLQSRRGVDDVPGDDPLALLGARAERDDRLAGRDPHADLEREIGIGGVEVPDRVQDAQRRAHGALRVVLVCHGRAEHGHHGVADELLHRAAVALDLAPEQRVVRPDACPHVLGIRTRRGLREPDEIAEEHADDLALLLDRRRRGCRQRRAAERAEREFAGNLPAARRARHEGESRGCRVANASAGYPAGEGACARR